MNRARAIIEISREEAKREADSDHKGKGKTLWARSSRAWTTGARVRERARVPAKKNSDALMTFSLRRGRQTALNTAAPSPCCRMTGTTTWASNLACR